MPTGYDVRLVRYNLGGARAGALHEVSFDATQAWGDIPTVTIKFSEAVWQKLPSLVEVALEVFDTTLGTAGEWVEPDNSRFILTEDDKDEVDAAGIKAMTAVGYVHWFLGKLIVFDPADIGDLVDGKRQFEEATSGEIVKTMFDEGLAAGWGDDPGWEGPLDYDFTETVDSAGTPWPSQITIGYAPGLKAWQAIANLYDQRMLDFSTTGRTLHLWVPDRGVDRSTGAGAIRLKRGIAAMPIQRDLNDLITKLRVFGEGTARLALDNPAAFEGLGALFGSVQQGGVSQIETMTLLAQGELDRGAQIRRQVRVVLKGATLVYRPHLDFVLGDWLSAPLPEGREKVRVFEVVTMKKSSGAVEVALVLNDRFVDFLVRLARRTVGIVGGSSAGGSGAMPGTEDGRAPKAPTGLVIGSSGYWDVGGAPKSVIEGNWTPVTQAVDNVAIGIAGYETFGRQAVFGSEWASITGTPTAAVAWSGFDPTSEWEFKVRAQSENGVWGDFSDVETVTMAEPVEELEQPTAAILSSASRVVTVKWDGFFDTDPPTTAPAQFMQMLVKDSDAEEGTYETIGALLDGQQVFNGFPNGTVRWFILVPVDRLGREGPASEPRSVEVTGVTSADILSASINPEHVVTSEAMWTKVLGAHKIRADEADIGSLTTAIIQAGASQILTLTAAQAINLIVTQLAPVQSQGNANAASLAIIGQFFQFLTSGLRVSAPGSPFAVNLDNDSLDFMEGGIVRAFLSAGEWNAEKIATSGLRVGNGVVTWDDTDGLTIQAAG